MTTAILQSANGSTAREIVAHPLEALTLSARRAECLCGLKAARVHGLTQLVPGLIRNPDIHNSASLEISDANADDNRSVAEAEAA